jgi:hypothetical protein
VEAEREKKHAKGMTRRVIAGHRQISFKTRLRRKVHHGHLKFSRSGNGHASFLQTERREREEPDEKTVSLIDRWGAAKQGTEWTRNASIGSF